MTIKIQVGLCIVVWSIMLIRYYPGGCSQIGVFLCLWAWQNEGLNLVNVEASSGLPLMLVVALEKRSLRD
jgi:hypothetical protein